jgi:hypothetical protein
MKKLAHCLGLFVVVLGLAAPAFAESKWEIEFSFSGAGPSATKMRDYMMGCLPKGSHVPADHLPANTGPFKLRTPKVGGHELSDNDIYNYLNTCNLKPASVDGISVTSED